MNGTEHPLLMAYFAPDELAALRQLWTSWQHYLDRLAVLPKALSHLDAHRGNLSWQGNDLALLDWAFVGEGALGEELAAFVGAALLLALSGTMVDCLGCWRRCCALCLCLCC